MEWARLAISISRNVILEHLAEIQDLVVVDSENGSQIFGMGTAVQQ
jgi:hypothetical protein